MLLLHTEPAIMYGTFLGAVINFIIVAFIMFMVIKAINTTKKAEAEAVPVPPPAQEVLLTENKRFIKK